MAARNIASKSAAGSATQQELKELHIQESLAHVPVFAVVNDKDEFVVTAGEVQAKERISCDPQLHELLPIIELASASTPVTFSCLLSQNQPDHHIGLFFFNEDDAKSLASSVSQMRNGRRNRCVCFMSSLVPRTYWLCLHCPSLQLMQMKAARSKVVKRYQVVHMNLGSIYNMVVKPRKAGEPAYPIFRFVPEPRQVEVAMNLLQRAGAGSAGFSGVPVFQAEGLTVTSDGRVCTPLFLR